MNATALEGHSTMGRAGSSAGFAAFPASVTRLRSLLHSSLRTCNVGPWMVGWRIVAGIARPHSSVSFRHLQPSPTPPHRTPPHHLKKKSARYFFCTLSVVAVRETCGLAT